MFKKIIAGIIVIGIGLYILHNSFNVYGQQIYGKNSIWGEHRSCHEKYDYANGRKTTAK